MINRTKINLAKISFLSFLTFTEVLDIALQPLHRTYNLAYIVQETQQTTIQNGTVITTVQDNVIIPRVHC